MKRGGCGCSGEIPCEDVEEGSCSQGDCYFHQTCTSGAGAYGGCGCVPWPTPAPTPAPPTPAPGPSTRYGCIVDKGQCVPVANATLTKDACESICAPQHYKCSGGQCVPAADATLSKQDCESMCVQLYQCRAGVCKGATSGVPQADCEANCGSEGKPALQSTTSVDGADLPVLA